MSKYPTTCCRCGFCCINEPCPISKEMGMANGGCQALDYDGVEATCKLATTRATKAILGIGQGCCMKARCYKDGIEYDFASLPPHIKRRVANEAYDKVQKYLDRR